MSHIMILGTTLKVLVCLRAVTNKTRFGKGFGLPLYGVCGSIGTQ